jgi:hypothetical protein
MSFRSNAKFIDFPAIAVIVLTIAIPVVVALTV